jgi:hypothetical protein
LKCFTAENIKKTTKMPIVDQYFLYSTCLFLMTLLSSRQAEVCRIHSNPNSIWASMSADGYLQTPKKKKPTT